LKSFGETKLTNCGRRILAAEVEENRKEEKEELV